MRGRKCKPTMNLQLTTRKCAGLARWHLGQPHPGVLPNPNRGQRRNCQSAANKSVGQESKGRCVAVSSSNTQRIDPITGSILGFSDAIEKKEVTINGLKWSYLEHEGDKDNKPTIVLIHGVLSYSYSYRQVIELLANQGYPVIAPDWPGHGTSEVPSPSAWNFTEQEYVQGLSDFIQKTVPNQPFVLVTQGFILGQFGLLYALENSANISKLVILNTPLKTGMPSELKKYQTKKGMFGMFAEKGPPKDVAADYWVAGGGPYILEREPANAYMEPYSSEESKLAVQLLMDNVEYDSLLTKINQGFMRWKVDSLVAFGTSDRYVDWKTAIEWLDSKRTNMKMYAFPDKMGHFVQEDYPERVATALMKFIQGENFNVKGKVRRVGDSTF